MIQWKQIVVCVVDIFCSCPVPTVNRHRGGAALLGDYWLGVRKNWVAVHAGGRLKQWLIMLRRNYPEACEVYELLRPIKGAADIDAALVAEGLLTPERRVA